VKFLRKFFELKETGFREAHEETFNMIRDYFSDIVDEQNIKEVFDPTDGRVEYHINLNYLIRQNGGSLGRFKTLNMVNLDRSKLNGAFIIIYENYAFKIILKYLRGYLKFPEFGEDVGIFKSRMEDEGFKVMVQRGSDVTEQDFGKKHAIFKDEVYLSILMFQTKEDMKRYQELKAKK